MRITTLLLAAGLLMTWNDQPNSWRGLTPLHSTCADVKKALGVKSCTAPISVYTLSDFRVMVEFANETCDSEPRAWRVSRGTVTAITISPQKEMLPSEVGLNLSKYQRREDDEIVGVVHYENREEGVTAFLYRGFVQTLYLYPRQSEQRLRCEPNSRSKNLRPYSVLDGPSGLAQIWLSVQPKTKVPVKLPTHLGIRNEAQPLYGIVESVSPSAYEIQLAFTTDCAGKDICHYGKVTGQVLTAKKGRPKGQAVSLTNGLKDYFIKANCRAICSDSLLVWDQGGYRYSVAVKAERIGALKKIANSAIAK